MTLRHLARPSPTSVGIVLGYAVDALLGDPRRGHPVAGFGQVALALERRLYADRRASGLAYAAVLVGGATGLGVLARRLSRPAPVRTVVTALATWTVLGGRSLRREAQTIAAQLEAGDLAAARVQVTHLVGRDTRALDAVGVARAAVESLAENTADAVVAPLFWGSVAGVPGLLGYRAVNTLDAMVGHRSARYVRFGWAAARLDDVANWVPARCCALATIVVAPLVDGSPGAAWRAVRRDAPAHPSPNAGVVEAAFAGALGLCLGGTNVYDGRLEDRGRLGAGREVEVGDLSRTVRLADLTALVALVGAAALTYVVRRRRP